MTEISPLRRRMIEDMIVRNLSPAPQQSYIYAVAKFSRHFGIAGEGKPCISQEQTKVGQRVSA